MILQVIFSVFNFLLVIGLLYKFAGPIVVKTLHEKHEANKRSIEEAEAAQAQAAAELAGFQKRLGNVDAELKDIVSSATQLAAQSAANILEAAGTDAERLRAQATQEVERERMIASQAIQRSMLAQALAAARAELQRQMNPETQRLLVSRFIQKVEDGSCAINP